MNQMEKKMCELVLNGGMVIEKNEFVSGEGISVECYTVEYLGEEYTLTKNDGEWVYFHHTIRPRR